MDKEPPNAAKVREFLGRGAGSNLPSESDRRADDDADPEAGPSVVHDESIPPTPASKDYDHPSTLVADSHAEGEGREPAAHPEVEGIEGPATTTVAVSEEEQDGTAVLTEDGAPAVPVPDTEGHDPALQPNESVSGLSTDESKMDEISLGGESVKGDAAAEEEIDLS